MAMNEALGNCTLRIPKVQWPKDTRTKQQSKSLGVQAVKGDTIDSSGCRSVSHVNI